MRSLRLLVALLLAFTGVVASAPVASAAVSSGPVSLTPARLLDTRAGGETTDGRFSGTGRIGAGDSTTITVLGRGGVPTSGVDAVVVNITGVQPSTATFVTAYPTGSGVPGASNLNLAPREIGANLAVVKVGSSGQISFFNDSGTTDLVVDIAGYYPSSTGFSASSPKRLLDTRAVGGSDTVDGQSEGQGPVGGGRSIALPVAGRAGVPSDARAAVLNVTAQSTAGTFVLAYPSGVSAPDSSTLNLPPGVTRANLSVVKLGSDGDIRLFNQAGNTHLVVDLQGWIAADGSYQPLTPGRFLDTRSGGQTIDGTNAGVGALGQGSTRRLTIAGRGGVPSDATAVYLNLTAVLPDHNTVVTAYPGGEARPTASNLNVTANLIRPNLVLAKLGAGGTITLHNDVGSTHLLVDVLGYVKDGPYSGPDPKLTQRITSLMTDSRVANADVGAVVADSNNGLELYTRNASTPLAPASNLKVLTSTAAMGVLGPDYRFRTVAYEQSKPVGGVLNGNLYLKGFGDPTLRESDLRSLAQQLRSSGLTKVSGQLVADASFFDTQNYSPSWGSGSYTEYYAGQVEGLTLTPDSDYDVGTIYVNYTGSSAGEPAKLTVTPASAASYVTLVNRTTTGASGTSDSVYAYRESPTSNRIIVGGSVAPGATGRDQTTVNRPSLFALHAFRTILAEEGITVTGSNTEGRVPSGAIPAASDSSMTLKELNVPFMKLSINGVAEHLTKTMGRVNGAPGTWSAGTAVIKAYHANRGIDMSSVIMKDGSGLAASNRLTARTMIAVLRQAGSEPWFPAWYNALPIAGAPDRMTGGTLRGRMIGTSAAYNFHGKTGTLTGVTALSGYVTGADGRPYVMSMVSNYTGSSPRPVEDLLVILLADWVYKP